MTLVELLVAMAIMGVISTMLLISWFTLSDSYSFTVRSADSRDSGRQAIARLQREIRDAERPPIGLLGTAIANDAAVYRARTYWIAFSTTFNEAGNDTADWQTVGAGQQAVRTTPHLVVYRLYNDGEIWRFEDGPDADNTISNVSLSPAVDNPAGFDVSEQQNGEGATLLVKDVVNWTAHATPVPLFRYSSYDSAGQLVTKNDMYMDERYGVVAVQVHMLVDLNPQRAPVYADLFSTAQLRNQR